MALGLLAIAVAACGRERAPAAASSSGATSKAWLTNASDAVRRWLPARYQAWHVAHAVLALGDDLQLADADGALVPSVDLLFVKYGIQETVDGGMLFGFPPPIDPHGFSYISEVLRAPIRFDALLTDLTITRGEFVRRCSAVIEIEKLAPEAELAWPLAAAFEGSDAWTSPPRDQVEQLARTALDRYEAELAAFLGAIRKNPSARPIPFLRMTCGGRHLLFAIVTAASAMSDSAFTQRLQILLKGEQERLQRELVLIDAWRTTPRSRGIARLAVLGHHVEVFGRAARRSASSALREEALMAARAFNEALAEVVRGAAGADYIGDDAFGGLCHGVAGLRDVVVLAAD